MKQSKEFGEENEADPKQGLQIRMGNTTLKENNKSRRFGPKRKLGLFLDKFRHTKWVKHLRKSEIAYMKHTRQYVIIYGGDIVKSSLKKMHQWQKIQTKTFLSYFTYHKINLKSIEQIYSNFMEWIINGNEIKQKGRLPLSEQRY